MILESGNPAAEDGRLVAWEFPDRGTAVTGLGGDELSRGQIVIPWGSMWFFEGEHLLPGQKRSLCLRYAETDYAAFLEREENSQAVRLLWEDALSLGLARELSAGQGMLCFRKLSSDTYALSVKEEITPDVSQTLRDIKEYIAARGFTYEDGTVENLYLCLKSKPFVILAGTSGTGKTRLARLFAAACGATVENGRYKQVAVRPDWSDSADLFGHMDLNGRFVPGPLAELLRQAREDLDKPYFLCLDEMNLARVEYYLSDILSVMETRELTPEGTVRTDPLTEPGYFGTDPQAAQRYGGLTLPENLYLIGTVNMDETTFPFSRKVLDRANTIEFSCVDLLPPRSIPLGEAPARELPNSFLKSEYLLLAHCLHEREQVEPWCLELQAMNRALRKANAQIGYRVRDEIVFYLLNNHRFGLLPHNQAMDNAIMQKILPRIQGSGSEVLVMLKELFAYCAGDFRGYDAGRDLAEEMERMARKPGCPYPGSVRKIAFMVRRYETDGAATYWL